MKQGLKCFVAAVMDKASAVFHRLACWRDLIKGTCEISSNDMPPLSDLMKGGISVRHERWLRLAVSSHVSKGGDQVVTTVTLFDKE